jgi:hypothetical protein
VITLAAAPFAGCGSDSETRNASGAGGSSSMTTTGTGGTGGGATGGSNGSGGGSGAKCTSTMSFLVEDSNIDDVVVDAKYAYYTQNNGQDSMPGGVYRVPLAGGAKELLTSSPQPIGIAVTKATVVFGDADGGIFTVPAGGGAKTKIAGTNGSPAHLLLSDGTVYFSDGDGTKSVPLAGPTAKLLTAQVAFSLTIWNQKLVLADFGGGSLYTVPLDGGVATPIATMQSGPLYPVVAGQDLVWANAGDLMNPAGANLSRLTTSGGTPAVISSGNALFHPHGLVFDGTNFYITADAGPDLAKVPAAGGTPTIIASLDLDAGLAVDDTCIYVAQPAMGLGMIAK